MMRWTRNDDRLLAKYRSQGMYFSEVAELLGRTESEVRARFAVIRLPGKKRLWAPDEIDFLKAHYGRVDNAVLCRIFRRPLHKIYNAAKRYGVAQQKKLVPPELHAFIRAKNAQGWTDAEIVRVWNAKHPELTFDRRSIQEHRHDRLRLPNNALHTRQRRRVAVKTREQCRLAGVNSLAEVRRQAFLKFAERNGWPGIARPRLVQILNLLYERGPHTREKIAAAIGMKWEASANHPASRRALKGNGPGGSYLAELLRLKLVVRMRRFVRTGGQGQNVNLYAIAPHVVRKLPAVAIHQPERKVS